MKLQTYSMVVTAPDEPEAEEWMRTDKRVLANLPALIEEVEENLTDLLPDGYHVTIEENRSE